MSYGPALTGDDVSHQLLQSPEPAVIVRGLRKVYQSYLAPTSESSGVFLWLRQLRQALRLTNAPPRTVVALDGIDLEVRRSEILGLMGPTERARPR